MREQAGGGSLFERAHIAWEALRSSFGFLSGAAMIVGLALGFGLPRLDETLNVDLPVFDFADQESARSLLETVATATVSVAGLSFSVTVVAFTLASSQLSPRVLRTFRSDRLSQTTLAIFLGTFVYCLTVLVRLGSAADGQPVPNLSVTLAIVLALVAFATFARFIAHIVRMLQPSSLIEQIRATGRPALDAPYPGAVGCEPEQAALAERAVAERRTGRRPLRVVAEGAGYLSTIGGDRVLRTAQACDGLVVQRARIGDYVVPGTALAEVWCDGDGEQIAEAVREAFVTSAQRTPLQDMAFPLRQLADIALKGLSPGINDPTTAENAMDAAASLLVASARGERPSPLRCDDAGAVRFVAQAPDLDALIRLTFEQVRVFAPPYPLLGQRLLMLLSHVEQTARDAGVPCDEAARQARLIAEAADADVRTAADAEAVRSLYASLWREQAASNGRLASR